MLDHLLDADTHRPATPTASGVRRVRPDLSIVVPTRNEPDNIEPLLDRLYESRDSRAVEIVFVDDSDDDTTDRIRAHADATDEDDTVRVRLVHRAPGERAGGLGGAVLEGLRRAEAEWVVVMDGDLQHPPELALQLPGVGRSRDLDLVVASRNVGAGNADGLAGSTRHLASGAATVIAKVVFPGRLSRTSDPMSGFFALRVAAVDLDRLRPTGFKILMEVMARQPRLRVADVPFAMAPRHAGESKASVAEVGRFLRHLTRLRWAVFTAQVRRSAGASPKRFLARAFLFGTVGLSGLVVNTGALVLALDLLHLHYLVGAVVATLASTTWLLLLTEKVVFRGVKPGTARSRAARFLLLNAITLIARLPLLALLVEWLHVDVVLANLATLALMFVVRFLVADAAIYGSGNEPVPFREPMRVVVDLTVPSRSTGASAPLRRPRGGHYLPFRYAIAGIATIGSQVELRELEYFRAQYLGHGTDIEVRVGPVGDAMPHSRATMTQFAQPPGIGYSEHFGRLGANFHVRLGEPIVVTVAPALARSPHVVYTNVLEALLRFVAVSKGAMLLHSACLELDGVGILISAETDTGKTGTVLRMVRELGARFLSDDMTVLYPDGRVGCFPKPLTISHHTLRAIGNDELSGREWTRLRLQSRLHSKEGRQFAMLLSRLNIPIMAVNALTQRLVPPPKYTVDRLLPCTILPTTAVSELFVISRGPRGAGELSRDEAMRLLLANTEDAYQFPPFRQLAPSMVIGRDDHAELRRKERAVLATALGGLRCRWISTPDFSWADEIPAVLAADRTNADNR